jgi:proteasome assembly chaperone (PAC2) family protein
MVPDELRWVRRPTLRRPVMIAAFEGWNDAGEAATVAIGHLAEEWTAQPFASIDPEEFFDFSATRPEVRLVEGGARQLVWPTNEFSAARMGSSGRDVILLAGNEPQLRWRAFCTHIIEVAKACGAELVVTLGALLADVPHSRPVRITGTGTDPELIERLALERSRYEGPTGIVGILHDALAAAGINSCSLWATVPHYLPGTPSPKAALALIERAGVLLDVPVETLDLQISTAQYERQVSEVVEADEDMAAYVQRLEISHDSGESLEDDDEDDEESDPRDAFRDSDGNLPTGDALAAELERYLRDQG